MNANDIIKQVQDHASEWIEMVENPDKFVSGILATKIINLMNRIEYLERRLENESSRKITIN